MERTKVGVIGCGNISGIYFSNMCKVFENLEVVACADLLKERAKAKATEFPCVKAMSVGKLLADPEIKIVVNLTLPKSHALVAMKAVKAGKSVHNEKPLTVTRRHAQKLLELAAQKGVLVGTAPDTFMGAGLQTCRKLIDDGVIGDPVAATAFMMCHGHEGWHPDPEFYYEVGGGPMFDMGPYYVTALVHLLGPVKRITGSARISFPTRTITSAKKNGKVVQVETPTHIAGVMDFSSGAVGTVITSFDVWSHSLPCIEIYGSKGSMQVPDPNCFGGQVRIRLEGEKDWREVPLTHSYAENSRGIGVADMAAALKSGRPHRASGELGYHVLDVMQAFHDASVKNRHIELKSTCKRPAPLPTGLPKGKLDE
jgi:predicted dehydrogenase